LILDLSDDYVIELFLGAMVLIGTAIVHLMRLGIKEIKLMRENLDTLKVAVNNIMIRMNLCKKCPKLPEENLITLKTEE
jgi:hypothetical protein